MKTIPILATVAVLLVSFMILDNAFAEKSGKEEVQSIMTSYKKAVDAAQKEFKSAVEKAQADARNAIAKGLPTDEINAQSKATIAKAKTDLKTAKDLAKKEAKKNLDLLKINVKP
ncbi:MAG: hypothetical protein EB153_03755 [Nitrosopumilaceae archaeon]|nr:hypothetical protein [Nitrosopumilaceae archaeon]